MSTSTAQTLRKIGRTPLAQASGVLWLLGGTVPEPAGADGRVFNTAVVLDPSGEVVARYRKIHLFDVDLGSDGGGAFRESATFAPGDEVVVAETPFGGLGMSVCYDLRFPELYRDMSSRGFQVDLFNRCGGWRRSRA